MKYLPKSAEFESFLDRLNGSLVAEFADEDPTRTDLPTLQIVGLPRSGTTVVFQLLAKTGLVGYPSNIMALFWQVPAVGARIQRHLRSSPDQVSLVSAGGRTPEPLDPHEFGYFWRHALGHAGNEMRAERTPTEPTRLQRILDQVNSVFGAPTVYKNFLVPVHVEYFSRLLSRQRFVVIRRSLVDVAASLLATRRRLGIAEDSWLGPVPADARDTYESSVHRVAHQAQSLDDTLRRSGLDTNSLAFFLDYEDVCLNPRESVAQICQHVAVDASEAALSCLPKQLTPHDAISEIADSDRRILLSLLDRT